MDDIKRDLYLYGEITDEKPMEIIELIHEINYFDGLKSSHSKPINLWLTTVGGESNLGLALSDVIKLSRTPVHIIALGRCFSIGITILSSGHKRMATENTVFMIHQGGCDLGGKIKDVKEGLDFTKMIDKKCDDVIINNTDITQDFLNKIYRKREDFNFDAFKALEIGLIEEIL